MAVYGKMIKKLDVYKRQVMTEFCNFKCAGKNLKTRSMILPALSIIALCLQRLSLIHIQMCIRDSMKEGSCLFHGKKQNWQEGRSSLHTALRETVIRLSLIHIYAPYNGSWHLQKWYSHCMHQRTAFPVLHVLFHLC